MANEKLIDCIVAGEANPDLILQDVPPLESNKEKTLGGFVRNRLAAGSCCIRHVSGTAAFE